MQSIGYLRRSTPLWVVCIAFMFAIMACTANDTFFIQLTATPVPSITPTPLSIDTKFKINDRVTVVGTSDSASVNLSFAAAAFRPGQGLGACFANTLVTILDVSKSTRDDADEMIYYQIQCPGSQPGWVAQYNLSLLSRQKSAVIKTSEGQGAVLYARPDHTTASPDLRCAEGEEVRISALRTSVNPEDKNVYAQVTCGGNNGFVLDDVLVLAS